MWFTDTAIYVQGNYEILSNLQEVVEEFCLASRAKINWHKSLGFGYHKIPCLPGCLCKNSSGFLMEPLLVT